MRNSEYGMRNFVRRTCNFESAGPNDLASGGRKPAGGMQKSLDEKAAHVTPRPALLILLACCAVPRLLAAAEPAAPLRLTFDGHLKQRLVWSPDGKQVLFTRHRGGKIGIVVMAAN